MAVLATLWMGCIGLIDDYLKFVEGKSRGLIARYKFVGQITFGVGLGAYLLFFPLANDLPPNATTLPFFKYVLVVLPPVVYVLFVTLVVASSSNAVNLTDGLDGLAAGLTVIAAAAFAIFAYIFGRVDAAEYLNVYYLRGSGELTVFCGSLMGAALGFLWYNAHPAQVFMGDTGSLAIGGAFGTVAILLKSEFLLLLVGGVFAAEAVSVIIQTGVFRMQRRSHGRTYAEQHRFFRMAPLHHHFERVGWATESRYPFLYLGHPVCAVCPVHAEDPVISARWREGEVAVIGLARSGVAAVEYLAGQGVPVYASDIAQCPRGRDRALALAGPGVSVELGVTMWSAFNEPPP